MTCTNREGDFGTPAIRLEREYARVKKKPHSQTNADTHIINSAFVCLVSAALALNLLRVATPCPSVGKSSAPGSELALAGQSSTGECSGLPVRPVLELALAAASSMAEKATKRKRQTLRKRAKTSFRVCVSVEGAITSFCVCVSVSLHLCVSFPQLWI